jgi:broad specificity phosphatase PhoE
MTIFLVRHGETEWNRVGRYQGWLDSPLTARGVAQAEAIGRRLCALPEAAAAGIVTSPIGRARRTAEIIAQCLGRTEAPNCDERLREISLGSWDGLDRGEIRARAPEIFAGEGRHEWYFRSPDGESYDAFAGRIAGWLAGRDDAPVIAVCHGVVTRVLRGLYAGLPRAAALRLPVPQDCIFRLAGGRIEEIAA